MFVEIFRTAVRLSRSECPIGIRENPYILGTRPSEQKWFSTLNELDAALAYYSAVLR